MQVVRRTLEPVAVQRKGVGKLIEEGEARLEGGSTFTAKLHHFNRVSSRILAYNVNVEHTQVAINFDQYPRLFALVVESEGFVVIATAIRPDINVESSLSTQEEQVEAIC